MKTTNAPAAETVLTDLAGIMPELYDALEGAAFTSRDLFAQKNRDVDPYYHASTFRYEAKTLLEARGFVLKDLANNGLHLVHQQYQLKILKADQGRVPCPGDSKPKREYYLQTSFLVETGVIGLRQLQIIPVNLLLIWDVTPKYALADLELACPQSGDSERDSAEVYWRITIPHPAQSYSPPPPAPADYEDDLDITLDNKETGQARQ